VACGLMCCSFPARRRCGTWGRTSPFPKSNRASRPGTSWRLRP